MSRQVPIGELQRVTRRVPSSSRFSKRLRQRVAGRGFLLKASNSTDLTPKGPALCRSFSFDQETSSEPPTAIRSGTELALWPPIWNVYQGPPQRHRIIFLRVKRTQGN